MKWLFCAIGWWFCAIQILRKTPPKSHKLAKWSEFEILYFIFLAPFAIFSISVFLSWLRMICAVILNIINLYLYFATEKMKLVVQEFPTLTNKHGIERRGAIKNRDIGGSSQKQNIINYQSWTNQVILPNRCLLKFYGQRNNYFPYWINYFKSEKNQIYNNYFVVMTGHCIIFVIPISSSYLSYWLSNSRTVSILSQ